MVSANARNRAGVGGASNGRERQVNRYRVFAKGVVLNSGTRIETRKPGD